MQILEDIHPSLLEISGPQNSFRNQHQDKRGSDICVATGIIVRCRRDARCGQCTGKRLSHTIWSSFNKERMLHLCDSTVVGPTAQRGNVLASKCEYPPFRYPPFKCARSLGPPTRRVLGNTTFVSCLVECVEDVLCEFLAVRGNSWN